MAQTRMVTPARNAKMKRVRVYRNLKHGRNTRPLYSVLYRGRVIKRVRRILLTDAKFIVLESGRQRVLRDKCKNVHAFVEGNWVQRGGAFGINANGKDFGMRVKYNPFKYNNFVFDAPGMWYHEEPITNAWGVLINERGITACYTYVM